MHIKLLEGRKRGLDDGWLRHASESGCFKIRSAVTFAGDCKNGHVTNTTQPEAVAACLTWLGLVWGALISTAVHGGEWSGQWVGNGWASCDPGDIEKMI
jgi:hypothetical protein